MLCISGFSQFGYKWRYQSIGIWKASAKYSFKYKRHQAYNGEMQLDCWQIGKAESLLDGEIVLVDMQSE